jgi:septal ring factor EnvC (AmiA/AmiB activator)
MGNTPDLFSNVSTSIKSLLFATGNLNHAIDAFASVAQKLEQMSMELEEKERKLRETERQLQVIKEELGKKDLQCMAKAAGLEKREQILAEKERQWEENEKRLAANTEDIIKLNVGMRFFFYK